MQDLTTKAGLAREADIDPRNPALNDLQPVGELKLRGNNAVKVYDRKEAVETLAKLLADAQKKFENEEKK
jgi:hypothetical protein